MSTASVDGMHSEGMILSSDPYLRIGKKHLWEERKWVEYRVGMVSFRN